MRIAHIIAFIAALIATGSAYAQTAAEQAACKADYEKFCASVMPGGGRIVKCLNEHLSELSPQCQQVVKENTSK
ncbi:MAG: cysteine rich repeat-containing protein [Mesorhizobium sp.]